MSKRNQSKATATEMELTQAEVTQVEQDAVEVAGADPARVVSAQIRVPGADAIGYLPSDVRVQQLTLRQREKLTALRDALLESHAMVGTRPVSTCADAVKWLLDQIEVV